MVNINENYRDNNNGYIIYLCLSVMGSKSTNFFVVEEFI